ncbi:MAG: putative Dynein light chain 1, axonemal, partial [Streblomastix strix]
KCLLLALPSFAYTGDIVIVDPVTLIPRVIHFGIGLTDLKLHTQIPSLMEKDVIGENKEGILDIGQVDGTLSSSSSSSIGGLSGQNLASPQEFSASQQPDEDILIDEVGGEDEEIEEVEAMSKPTTIQAAIKIWEEKNQKVASESEEIKLYYQIPPIEKMDNSLSTLRNCRQLALSTNRIDRIANLGGLERLELLSLGRNLIKKIEGLEPVAGTLRTLWLSYNSIDRVAGVLCCKHLQCLYISHNNISNWAEIDKLNELPELNDVSFIGNPIEQSSQSTYKAEVLRRLPTVKKLDGALVDAAISGDEGEDDGGNRPTTGHSQSQK